MDRKTATEVIKSRWRDLYPADKSKKGIICPICKSGSGKNGTGITEKPGSKHFLKCWNGGCDFNSGGSVIDLYMIDNRMDPQSDFSRAVDELAEKLSIQIDPAAEKPAAKHSTAAPSFTSNPASAPAAAAAQQPTNYSAYYEKCKAALIESAEARAYLEKRGIEPALAMVWGVGFDPEWKSPTVIKNQRAKGNTWEPNPKPCIIIPSSPSHYVARDIRPAEAIPDSEKQFQKMNEGTPAIFGLDKLREIAPDNVFVVEGGFDALSILEAGQLAIALNSTSNAEKLIEELEKQPISTTFVLCLDNDQAGRKASDKLKEGLRRLNISCVSADICCGHKDPNEALTADRDLFLISVKRAITAKPDNSSLYIDTVMGDDIKRRQEAGKKKTGLANLDAVTGGGLRPGLVLLGAISSLGKTTFCSQIADGFAENGNDVIYFSMEQSRLEMISKSLSRRTAQIDMDSAVTGTQIMDGEIPSNGAVARAAEQYKAAVGDRLSIVEAGFNCDTMFITDYVRRYHARTGKRPVVFVDYLQILKPGELPNGRRQDTRETVEECLRQLVLLKRDLDLTIIAIVSLNRSNYLQPFDFEAIKETGLAEYSGDVVWGLQLTCLDDELFTKEGKLKEKRDKVKAAKREIPRKVKLCSLKHRGQNPIYEVYFDYYPQYDLFVPAKDIPASTAASAKNINPDTLIRL